MNNLRKLFETALLEGVLIHNLDFEIEPTSGFLVELPFEQEHFKQPSLNDFLSFVKKKSKLLAYSENYLYIYKDSAERWVFSVGVFVADKEEAESLSKDYNNEYFLYIPTKSKI